MLRKAFKKLSFIGLVTINFSILEPAQSAMINYFMPDHNLASPYGWYATLGTGVSRRNNESYGNGTKKFKLGPFLGLAIGNQINPYLRLEGELANRENAIQILTDHIVTDPITATELSIALMLNAYFSPMVYHQFTPYIGFGLGYAMTRYGLHVNFFPPPSFSHSYQNTTNFAYQAMLGLGYDVTDNLNLAVEYRYFRVPTITYTNTVNTTNSSNDFLFKMSYTFDPSYKTILANSCPIRWYLATEGGISYRNREDYGTGTKKFQNGPFVGAAFGYNYLDVLRVEGEFSFRQNTVNTILLGIGNHDRPTGDENTYAYMLNAYFSPLKYCNFIPYIGAGIGYSRTTYAVHVFIPPSLPAFAHPRLTSTGLAYQGMLGTSYLFSQNFMAGLEYRYFTQNHMHYKRVIGPNVNTTFNAQTVLLRFTYLF